MLSTIWTAELARCMTPIDGLYPKDTGYTFIDPTGTKITGSTLADLIVRVRRWRSLNGLPAGDAAAEVAEYLCRKNPSYCRGGAPAPPPPPPTRLLAEKVLAWLGRIGSAIKAPARGVDVATASARAAACRNCRFHRDYVPACRGCSASALAVRKAWVSGEFGTATENVYACAQYGYDAAVALQLGPDKMPPDRHAPDGCWRKPDITIT